MLYGSAFGGGPCGWRGNVGEPASGVRAGCELERKLTVVWGVENLVCLGVIWPVPFCSDVDLTSVTPDGFLK